MIVDGEEGFGPLDRDAAEFVRSREGIQTRETEVLEESGPGRELHRLADHLGAAGFDHHSSAYWQLNSGCVDHYLYTYSSGVLDGDQSYQASRTLGNWGLTAACTSSEGGGLSFYAGVR